MITETFDASGLRYPECILKIATKAAHMNPGEILEVLGDCEDFEKNLRAWCTETGRVFLATEDEEGDKKRIQIQF
jgi:TusA-related sulfurtransferase